MLIVRAADAGAYVSMRMTIIESIALFDPHSVALLSVKLFPVHQTMHVAVPDDSPTISVLPYDER
jgi:hypothetical protein